MLYLFNKKKLLKSFFCLVLVLNIEQQDRNFEWKELVNKLFNIKK